ncbi:hypothetical protein MMC25_001800 [Agyrium rufum]|nr:hypothetical protein [Agyrium rufum]
MSSTPIERLKRVPCTPRTSLEETPNLSKLEHHSDHAASDATTKLPETPRLTPRQGSTHSSSTNKSSYWSQTSQLNGEGLVTGASKLLHTEAPSSTTGTGWVPGMIESITQGLPNLLPDFHFPFTSSELGRNSDDGDDLRSLEEGRGPWTSSDERNSIHDLDALPAAARQSVSDSKKSKRRSSFVESFDYLSPAISDGNPDLFNSAGLPFLEDEGTTTPFSNYDGQPGSSSQATGRVTHLDTDPGKIRQRLNTISEVSESVYSGSHKSGVSAKIGPPGEITMKAKHIERQNFTVATGEVPRGSEDVRETAAPPKTHAETSVYERQPPTDGAVDDPECEGLEGNLNTIKGDVPRQTGDSPAPQIHSPQPTRSAVIDSSDSTFPQAERRRRSLEITPTPPIPRAVLPNGQSDRRVEHYEGIELHNKDQPSQNLPDSEPPPPSQSILNCVVKEFLVWANYLCCLPILFLLGILWNGLALIVKTIFFIIYWTFRCIRSYIRPTCCRRDEYDVPGSSRPRQPPVMRVPPPPALVLSRQRHAACKTADQSRSKPSRPPPLESQPLDKAGNRLNVWTEDGQPQRHPVQVHLNRIAAEIDAADAESSIQMEENSESSSGTNNIEASPDDRTDSNTLIDSLRVQSRPHTSTDNTNKSVEAVTNENVHDTGVRNNIATADGTMSERTGSGDANAEENGFNGNDVVETTPGQDAPHADMAHLNGESEVPAGKGAVDDASGSS